MRIGVDALGGDYSPKVPVQAAVETVLDKNWEIILFGDRDIIQSELHQLKSDKSPRISIQHCTQTIEMTDNVQVALRKKDSSIRVGYQALKNGDIDGFVSAGHSGAMLAIGKSVLKTLGDISRPCISALMPTVVPGRNMLLADAGANMDCEPNNLLQFALLGSIYMKSIHDVSNPRIGLLNVGEEPGKGNSLAKEAYELLSNSSLNFVGNIEGKVFLLDSVDVLICDGFPGNVLLKTSQGVLKLVKALAMEEFKGALLPKLALPFLYLSLRKVLKRLDYARYGGAPLLGLDGISIVCHGSSNVDALKYAINFSGWAKERNLIEKMRVKLEEEKEFQMSLTA